MFFTNGKFAPAQICFSPYARELISNLVNRGTFPALNLSPVNFDALFIDYMNKQQAAAEAEENQETQH